MRQEKSNNFKKFIFMVNNDPFAADAVPRRVMHLIFLVDTSGSMRGAKIASLNTAVREALNDVGEISKNNSDAQIKIAVLEFASDIQWMYPQPQDSETFQWQDLQADGVTSLGAAYNELNDKLSRSHGFMAEPTGSRAPAIILLTDGQPTDEYRHALDKLNGNRWFKSGVKVAIAIGDDETNVDTLAEFTGNKEAVITVHNVDQLKKIIHTVSVTSSMVASQSASVGASSNDSTASADLNKQVTDNITNTIASDQTLNGVDQGDSKANSGTDDWSNW